MSCLRVHTFHTSPLSSYYYYYYNILYYEPSVRIMCKRRLCYYYYYFFFPKSYQWFLTHRVGCDNSTGFLYIAAMGQVFLKIVRSRQLVYCTDDRMRARRQRKKHVFELFKITIWMHYQHRYSANIIILS